MGSDLLVRLALVVSDHFASDLWGAPAHLHLYLHGATARSRELGL